MKNKELGGLLTFSKGSANSKLRLPKIMAKVHLAMASAKVLPKQILLPPKNGP